MPNTINWFEIPVTNFARAKKFYSEIFGADIHETEMGPYKMGFLPYDEGKVSGAIVQGEGYNPSKEGTLIYLNGGDDLSGMLAKVEAAGGKVVKQKTLITEQIGYDAIFIDTEGNKVALHSPK
jgi:predicted enzyme related to lactoylglutathione lyase